MSCFPMLMGGASCNRYVRRATAPPVLFLTARDSVDDRVKGLELGAE